MAQTYTGYGGVPYLTERDAAASFAGHSSLTTTDPYTSRTYMSDYDRKVAEYEERKRRG